MTRRSTSILVDADDREVIHDRLSELITELDDEWSGPVRIDLRTWDSYTHILGEEQ